MLTDSELDDIRDLLGGREPNRLEVAMFDVMWSEHCSYKSSRIHLKRFPTEAEWVLVGPGEGAGVVDVGDGIAAAIRIESHNHPSAIEPYQGAATGAGGILRDVDAVVDRAGRAAPEHPRTRVPGERARFRVVGVEHHAVAWRLSGEQPFDRRWASPEMPPDPVD